MTYFYPSWQDNDPDDSDEFLAERRAELEALLIELGEHPRYAAYLAEVLSDDEVQAWLAPLHQDEREAAYAAELDDDIPF